MRGVNSTAEGRRYGCGEGRGAQTRVRKIEINGRREQATRMRGADSTAERAGDKGTMSEIR